MWPNWDSNPGSLVFHRAMEPHNQLVTFSSCLIRFIPESARNHAGTDETIPSRSPSMSLHWPPNVTGVEKEHGPGSLAYHASKLPLRQATFSNLTYLELYTSLQECFDKLVIYHDIRSDLFICNYMIVKE